MICVSVLDSSFQCRCAKSIEIKFDKEYDFTSNSLVLSCLKVFFITAAVRARGLDILVLGDLRSWCQILAAYLWSPVNLIIVDDGVFSLSLFETLESGRITNSKTKNLLLKFIIGNYQSKNRLKFHTVFGESTSALEARKSGYDICALTIEADKTLNVEVDSSTVLFIGQDIVELDIISRKEYLLTLKRIALKAETSQKQLIYYPHRAESGDKLKLISSHIPNCRVVNREIPIEDYLVLMAKRPFKIYTFYSTSVFIISRLFPNIKCYVIYLENTFKTHIAVIEAVYTMFKNDKGIKVETFNLND